MGLKPVAVVSTHLHINNTQNNTRIKIYKYRIRIHNLTIKVHKLRN